MKKTSFLFAGLLFLLLSLSAKAQKTGADYFAGKWSVLIKGTPGGDAKMIVVLTKKDSALTGVILDTTGAQTSKIDKIEVNGNEATIYFNAQGYDVNLVMTKKDDDHFTGSLIGMFDADGERVKQEKAIALKQVSDFKKSHS
ncbi:MAG: hypothetical protein HY252_05105 [Sphingobacteriales bacterium]|nr:hypothetical protein [Sphingobacteriales bacterium]